MNYGMILNESADFYHASDGVSSHRLSDFARPQVPLYYYKKYIEKSIAPDEPTEALRFGEYMHTLALEGETVADSRFCVSPKFDRRTKAGKEGAESFAQANAGKTVISAEDFSLAWQMVKSIREKPKTRALFDHGKPEVVFRHKMSSFDLRARLDWFDDRLDDWGRPLIVDIKTIDHLSSFDKHFFSYNYYKQAAFYRMVVYETLKLQGAYPRFAFVVVEKNEPFQSEVRVPGEISMDIAQREVLAELTRLKGCYDTGIWPGVPDEPREVELPEWKQVKGPDVG